MRIVLELETTDPETLLSSDALSAFKALRGAGIEVIWVTPSEGITDPPIVARLRDALVNRGRRLEATFTRARAEAVVDAFMEHRRAGREP